MSRGCRHAHGGSASQAIADPGRHEEEHRVSVRRATLGSSTRGGGMAASIGRVLILAGALAACSRAPRLSGQGEGKGDSVAARTINQVLAAHADSLMALP